MERIILVVLSEIDPGLVNVLKEKLELTFYRMVEVRYSVKNLSYAYDPKRKQFVSPRLIARLRRIKRNNGDKVLGITNVDLYSPDYDFVFGEAEMSSGVATLSIYRLKDERWNAGVDLKVLEERTIREAIHELGHLFKLGHCPNPKCVMHACICVEDVDKAGRDFCDQCSSDLEDNLSEKIMSPSSH
jgi:archaemetzincin